MLEVKHLRKEYKSKKGVVTKALDDVSLTFAETGMVFILGKSGSGKSTLLNVCGGLDKADSGEIIIKGKSSNDFSSQDFDSYRNTYVGFVFQEYNILDEFTVEENIALALELQNKKRDKAVIDKILADVDMTSFASRKPNTLSGGQKQRVAIARALVKEPEIIMADEPTGALDSKTGQQVFDTLKKLSETKLVIVISHDRDFAEQYGDRIIELKDGKIISDQTRAEEGEGAKNVRFFGSDTVCVSHGAELTDEDMQSIRKFLNKSGGAAVISTSRERISAMKQDLPEMSMGEFEDLKAQPQSKAYPQQKLIRSHLPARHAIRMGASSLKTKPVRLMFTIILSVIAFILFGLASTLMLFDGKSVTKETLVEVNDSHIVIGKAYYVNEKYYYDGKLDSEYEFKRDTKYTYKEYEQIQQKYSDAIAGFSVSLNMGNVKYTDISRQFYSDYIDGVVITGNAIKYTAGRAPAAADEVALSDFTLAGLMLERTEFKYDTINDEGKYERVDHKISKAADIIYSDTNNIKMQLGDKEYKVTGIYEAMKVPEVYMEFKAAADENRQFNDGNIQWQWSDSRQAGLYNKIAIAEEFADSFISMSNNDEYFDFYQYFNNSSAPVYIGVPDSNGELSSEYSNMLNKYSEEGGKPLLNVYDLDNNKLTSLPAGTVAMRYSALGSIYSNAYNTAYNKLYNETYEAMDKAAQAARDKYYEEHGWPGQSDFVDYVALQAARDKYEADAIAVRQAAYDSAEAEFVKNNKAPVAPDPTKYENNEDKDNPEYISDLNYYRNVELPGYERQKSDYAVDKANIAQNEFYNNNNYPQEDDFTDFDAYDAAQEEYYAGIEAAVNAARIEAAGKLKNYMLLEQQVKAAARAKYLAENPEPDRSNNDAWNEWNWGIQRAEDSAWNYADPFSDLYNLSNGNYSNPQILEKLKSAKVFLDEWNALDELQLLSSFDNSSTKIDVVGVYFEGGRYAWNAGVYLSDELYEKCYVDYGYSSYSVMETKYQELDGAYITYVFIPNTGAALIDELVEMSYERHEDDSTINIKNSAMNTIEMMIGYADMLSMGFLIAGLVLALFAFLLMFNFISASITAKKKEIGILRAIGARTTDVFKIFLSESMIIALICVVISVVGTALLCLLLNNTLMDTAFSVTLFVFGPISVLSVLGIAAITAIVSTLIPVGIYSRKPPVASIRAL